MVVRAGRRCQGEPSGQLSADGAGHTGGGRDADRPQRTTGPSLSGRCCAVLRARAATLSCPRIPADQRPGPL